MAKKKKKTSNVAVIKAIAASLLAILAAGGAVALTYSCNEGFRNWVDGIGHSEPEEPGIAKAWLEMAASDGSDAEILHMAEMTLKEGTGWYVFQNYTVDYSRAFRVRLEMDDGREELSDEGFAYANQGTWDFAYNHGGYVWDGHVQDLGHGLYLLDAGTALL